MAFCSACDRPVPVALKPGAALHEPAIADDAIGVICLVYGVSCTGAFCPLFSVPGDDAAESAVAAAAAGPRGA